MTIVINVRCTKSTLSNPRVARILLGKQRMIILKDVWLHISLCNFILNDI